MKRAIQKISPQSGHYYLACLIFLLSSFSYSVSSHSASVAYQKPQIFSGTSVAHQQPRFDFSWWGCCFLQIKKETANIKTFNDFPPYDVIYAKGSFSKNNTLTGANSLPENRLIAQQDMTIPRFPDEPPLEPAGYRMDKYRGPVPTTLKGAIVVNSKRAKEIYLQGKTIFIDVMPYIPKPPNLPKTMIWREKIRENIEGSHWLANVGYGALPSEMTNYFQHHLKRLTKNDFTKPLLFYCQEKCWMSWNAAKRALEYGYRSVYWYPRGTDGWVKMGGKVIKASPIALPNMTRRLTQ